MNHLKVEKSLTDKLREQLESHMDLELEQKSRIKMLEQHNKELTADEEEKTRIESSMRIELDEYTSQVEILKQEQQHLADARAVKLSIVSLQDALIDKVNLVEVLIKTTQTEKSKQKDLTARLEDLEGSRSTHGAKYE